MLTRVYTRYFTKIQNNRFSAVCTFRFSHKTEILTGIRQLFKLSLKKNAAWVRHLANACRSWFYKK